MSLLNPRVDFAFKKLFGREENKDILISFINAVVPENERIVDLVLLDPYNHKQLNLDKLSILDINKIKGSDSNANVPCIIDQGFTPANYKKAMPLLI